MKSAIVFSFGIIFTGAMPAWSLQFAGGLSDGGGNAVVCMDANKNIKSAEVFDLYEARNLYNFKVKDQGAKSVLEIALAAGQAIDVGGAADDPSDVISNHSGSYMRLRTTNVSSDFVQAYVRYVAANMKLLEPGAKLEPIDDSKSILIPGNCEFSQLARYVDTNDKIYVNSDIWNRLDNVNKAALLVHEALYKKLRMNGENTSERARAAVGAAMAGLSFTPINEDVPAEALLCWSDKNTEYRFAVYENQNREAVFQFFHLDGKIPLTKTSFKTDLAYSPISSSKGGGASVVSEIKDSILDQGYKIHWNFSNSGDHLQMTMGNQKDSHAVHCAKDTYSDFPWPWEVYDGQITYDDTMPRAGYILPQGQVSCYQLAGAQPGDTLVQDVGSNTVQVRNLSISWNEPDADLYVASIVLEFENLEGKSYTGTISGKELASLDGSHGRWNAKIPRSKQGKDSIFDAACSLTFGNVHDNLDKEKPFTTIGSLKVVGYSRDSQGHEQPVKFMRDFKVIFQGGFN
jgi:hypothetical protein